MKNYKSNLIQKRLLKNQKMIWNGFVVNNDLGLNLISDITVKIVNLLILSKNINSTKST